MYYWLLSTFFKIIIEIELLNKQSSIEPMFGYDKIFTRAFFMRRFQLAGEPYVITWGLRASASAVPILQY